MVMSKDLENMAVDELCRGFDEADKRRVQSYADDDAVIGLAQARAELKGTDADNEKLELVKSYIADCNYG